MLLSRILPGELYVQVDDPASLRRVIFIALKIPDSPKECNPALTTCVLSPLKVAPRFDW